MKNKRTETENNKKEKEKKNKKVTIRKDEDEKVNTYEQYRIEKIDLISQSSDDDIEAKMIKLMEIKKKGGNLEEYNQNEINKIKFTKMPLNTIFSKEEIKEQPKEEDKLIRIKKGINNLINFISINNIQIKKKIISEFKAYSKQSKAKKSKKNVKEKNSNKKPSIAKGKNNKKEEVKNNIKKKKIKLKNLMMKM